jgi:hypothetical protein
MLSRCAIYLTIHNHESFSNSTCVPQRFYYVYQVLVNIIVEEEMTMFSGKMIDDAITTSQMKDEIKKADLVIADVSEKDPDLMFQLGLVSSLGKPLIPISCFQYLCQASSRPGGRCAIRCPTSIQWVRPTH